MIHLEGEMVEEIQVVVMEVVVAEVLEVVVVAVDKPSMTEMILNLSGAMMEVVLKYTQPTDSLIISGIISHNMKGISFCK